MSSSLKALAAVAALTVLSVQAQAATIRVQCEKRGDRSVVSVDGKNLVRGSYTAQALSGGSTAAAPARATVGDEVEFDFSSQPNDIAAGATAIATTFIVVSNGAASVTGKILNAAGETVISDTVACRVRSR